MTWLESPGELFRNIFLELIKTSRELPTRKVPKAKASSIWGQNKAYVFHILKPWTNTQYYWQSQIKFHVATSSRSGRMVYSVVLWHTWSWVGTPTNACGYMICKYVVAMLTSMQVLYWRWIWGSHRWIEVSVAPQKELMSSKKVLRKEFHIVSTDRKTHEKFQPSDNSILTGIGVTY